jgi:hypothetical protein
VWESRCGENPFEFMEIAKLKKAVLACDLSLT